MTFGSDTSSGARITTASEFKRVLDRLQERGYGEVDTARVYVNGTQEGFTREAGRWKDRGLVLATKIVYPAQGGDNAAAKVGESLDVSLRELGAECVDVCVIFARPPPQILSLPLPGKNMSR